MNALLRKDSMSGKYALYLIVFMLLGVLLVKYLQDKRENKFTPGKTEQTQQASVINNAEEATIHQDTQKIPVEAIEIFQYAMTHGGETKADYRGNTPFGNRERKLPQSEDGVQLKYKEYDIYPWVKGKSRGPERVVISSKGIGYYTADHYNTFVKIE